LTYKWVAATIIMDGGKQFYGYWHRFNWIASIVEPKSLPATVVHPWEGWLYIDRLVGLSAEIFSISKPCQTKSEGRPYDNPSNGSNITDGEIENLTGSWSDLDFDEIEGMRKLLIISIHYLPKLYEKL
jgi:hypothetical protein